MSGDRAAVSRVAAASGLFSAADLVDVVASFDASVAGDAGDAGDRWLVDDDGSGATAVAHYAPERMTDGTWNLLLVAVHPEVQGSGRGRALVRHVEDDLRRIGARLLLIETSGVPEFAGQRAFYERLGYQQEARIRDFYEAGDDKVVFWKLVTTRTDSDR